jgi:hypothetical protein
MSGRTKPKRTRRVWDCLNPITVALNASTLFTQAERDSVMAPRRDAMAALRRGQATELQWLHLATCAQVALCIEDLGVVKGLRQQFTEADRALCQIDQRARTPSGWRPPTCYGHELVTLDTLITLHAFQIEQLSAGEYRRAIALAKARQLTHGGKIVRAVDDRHLPRPGDASTPAPRHDDAHSS